MPASTVHRVLARHGLNRLDALDRATRAPIRRIVTSRARELVHVDIKKRGRIPKGGGRRVHGRTARPSNHRTRKARSGYAYVHFEIDGYSRLAYGEVLVDEQGRTAAEFVTRALAFISNHDITVHRVLSDHSACYRSDAVTDALEDIPHTFTSPTDPQPTAKSSASTAPFDPTRMVLRPIVSAASSLRITARNARSTRV